MSTKNFEQLLERATPGPWFLGPRSPYPGYRYALRRDVGGHGWDLAHICNDDDADSNAELIARCNPATMRIVLEALKLADDNYTRTNHDMPDHMGDDEHEAWGAVRRALFVLNSTPDKQKENSP